MLMMLMLIVMSKLICVAHFYFAPKLAISVVAVVARRRIGRLLEQTAASLISHSATALIARLFGEKRASAAAAILLLLLVVHGVGAG